MPYYFGEGDPGWDEMMMDAERSPRAAQFRYLSPPEWGSVSDPAYFTDQIPPPPASPPPQASPATPAAPPTGAPSLLDRLLGRRSQPLAPTPPSSRAEREAERKRQEEEAQRHSQHWLALLVGALREIGARSAYGRYDGGNDEGFAWLDHVVLESGERLGPDEVGARLAATDLAERLAEAGLWHSRGRTRLEDMQDTARYTFAEECAVRLLGTGFGTGPFYLYGAFTVDLHACTIADDHNADPIIENIDIER